MTPIVLKNGAGCMIVWDSTSGLLASVEKILLITLCASQPTWQDVYRSQPGGIGAFSYARDGFFMQVNVLNDSARADFFAAEFKLGFDENKKIRALLGASRGRSQYFA